jgi:peptidyl-prolyl cis-trans isomerase B (cyclophilin B)
VARADKRQRQKDNARLAREAREAAIKRKRQIRTARNAGIFGVIVVVVILILTLTGKSNKKSATKTTTTTVAPTTTTFVAPGGPTATIKTNFGTIVVRLDTKKAPKAAARFIALAKQGKYNHLKWVRSSKNFVIQGGSPNNTQSGGFGNPIVGEVPKDHYPLASLAAAKTGADPAGTYDAQFFIVTGSGGATLPNDYARFGEVTKGLAVAQKIEALAPASGDGAPTKTATIDTITISGS